MLGTYTTTGGARVGWTNASYPLARLSVTPDELTLSIRLLGTYTFAPGQVASIERYVMIPVIASGILIDHCRTDYPKRVIFWSWGKPDKVLAGIREAGFQPTAPASEIPPRSGFALRWSTIIIAILLWNALFMLTPFFAGGNSHKPGPFTILPLAIAFAACLGALYSPALQRLLLKPGRHIGEIRPFLRLLIFILGILLVVFSTLVASGAF